MFVILVGPHSQFSFFAAFGVLVTYREVLEVLKMGTGMLDSWGLDEGQDEMEQRTGMRDRTG
jgi:hypothetical protein